MKIARLKVVASSTRPGLSLRGPKGRGHQDSVHEHVTAAGFEPDEDVVLISKTEFVRLINNELPTYPAFLKEELILQGKWPLN